MSDRTARSPELALQQLTDDINYRLTQIAKRIRWQSGTPDVYEVGDIAVPSTDLSPGTTFTHTLLSFQVDPGRWTIMASAYWRPTTLSANALGRSGIGIVVGSDIIGRSDGVTVVSTNAFEGPHFASGTFVANQPTTVLLRAYALYFEALNTSVFRHSRLSGVGG